MARTKRYSEFRKNYVPGKKHTEDEYQREYIPRNKVSKIYQKNGLTFMSHFMEHSSGYHGHKSSHKTNRMVVKRLRRILDNETRKIIEDNNFDE